MESLNARLRKIVKTRGHFPCADAATELIWLTLPHINKEWAHAAHNCKSAMIQLAILYGERCRKPST